MGLFQKLNGLAVGPFKAKLPLVPVAGLFLVILIISIQWRLIVDRIDQIEEEI